VSVGKIIYYEDGSVGLGSVTHKGQPGKVFREGSWFSSDLQSEAFSYKKKQELIDLKSIKPESAELIDCVLQYKSSKEPKDYMPAICTCVKSFN
jgi:hypothetical protein